MDCNASNNFREPWPENVVLYQPYETEQILLAENASCLAVKAYLKMCNLSFHIRSCANAEFMSPGGHMTKLPVLQAGSFIFSEFTPIINFVKHKGEELGTWMKEDEKLEMRTYVSLTENTLTMAELYISFMVKRVYDEFTAPRNGCMHPWPLNKIQNFIKLRQAKKLLTVYQWKDMEINDVLTKVCRCCEILQAKLQESSGLFFYGEKPCELDAIVFGHLFSMLSLNLPDTALQSIVQQFKLLMKLCHFIDEEYFQKKSESSLKISCTSIPLTSAPIEKMRLNLANTVHEEAMRAYNKQKQQQQQQQQ
uniref:Metaxin-2 n=1 Tax=Glossina brevipalpis TaxID=37001 RepID=A0A1A9WBU0_9MUSC